MPPRKPRLLDLFCCAGGAGVGYARAGFEVVGVDIAAQPRYPFEFIRSGDVKRHTLDRLASLMTASFGPRLTYKELIA